MKLSEKNIIIGIDLGTTHSLVAVYEEGQPKIIPNALGKAMTPSVVGIDQSGTLLIGEPAKERLDIYPQDTVASFKRFMGSEKKTTLGKYIFRPEELSALILKRLKEDAEDYLGVPVKKAVISVPAYFNEIQRGATKAAAEIAGLEVTRLINEPTAAALAYGILDKKSERTFMVVDLGGGTFDVSILEMFEGVMEIRSSAGDNVLGGDDFTQKIIEDFLSEAHEKNNLKPEKLSQEELAKIKTQAEKSKYQLAHDPQTEISFQWDGRNIQWVLSREKFEKICEPLIERLCEPLERVMQDAKLKVSDIDGIFLAGGATRMPIIRSVISKLFQIFPSIYLNPDEVIAMGAAVQAGLLLNDKALEELVMTDVCPYTLGIKVNEVDSEGRFIGEGYEPMIERNTVIPYSYSKTFFYRSGFEKSAKIEIYQGEAYEVKNNIFLGSFDFNFSITPKKTEIFEIRFTYDVNGLLEVEATLLSTKQTERVLIQNGTKKLSQEEIFDSLEKLTKLKIHPRDETENCLLMSKLEKLHEILLGDHREYIRQVITYFKTVLEKQNKKIIEKERKIIEANLYEFEKSLSDIRY